MNKREAASSTREDREVEPSNKRIKTDSETTCSTASWTFEYDEYKQQSENWFELGIEEQAERFEYLDAYLEHKKSRTEQILAEMEQMEAKHAQLMAWAEQLLEECRPQSIEVEKAIEERILQLEESSIRLSNIVALETIYMASAAHDITDDAWDCESFHGGVDFYDAVNHPRYRAFNDDDDDDRSISSTFDAGLGPLGWEGPPLSDSLLLGAGMHERAQAPSKFGWKKRNASSRGIARQPEMVAE